MQSKVQTTHSTECNTFQVDKQMIAVQHARLMHQWDANMTYKCKVFATATSGTLAEYQTHLSAMRLLALLPSELLQPLASPNPQFCWVLLLLLLKPCQPLLLQHVLLLLIADLLCMLLQDLVLNSLQLQLPPGL